ncbi:MAG TPA: hypothetical protein VL332_05945, partial [Candidatus Saccharimonadaceae bacterium]|nr:hypothetical protein [Candidatus Saccharimonadaceae bacterium]
MKSNAFSRNAFRLRMPGTEGLGSGRYSGVDGTICQPTVREKAPKLLCLSVIHDVGHSEASWDILSLISAETRFLFSIRWSVRREIP